MGRSARSRHTLCQPPQNAGVCRGPQDAGFVARKKIIRLTSHLSLTPHQRDFDSPCEWRTGRESDSSRSPVLRLWESRGNDHSVPHEASGRNNPSPTPGYHSLPSLRGHHSPEWLLLSEACVLCPWSQTLHLSPSLPPTPAPIPAQAPEGYSRRARGPSPDCHSPAGGAGPGGSAVGRGPVGRSSSAQPAAAGSGLEGQMESGQLV